MERIQTIDIRASKKPYSEVKLLDALKKQNALFTSDDVLYLRLENNLAHIVPAGNSGQLMFRRHLLSSEASRIISQQALDNAIKNIMVDPEFEAKDLSIANDKVLWNNGILNLLSGEFTEGDATSLDGGVSPSVIYLYKINADYIKGAAIEDASSFMQYLETSLVDDSIPLLLQALGYILSPTQKMKKAVFLIGKPNTGKSLILELIRRLLGKKVISELDLTQISQTNGNVSLLNKQCNISEDFGSTNRFNLSEFKRAVGNEHLTMSNKYERIITAPVRAKFIVAGNAFPRIPINELPPFIERILLIPFIKEIPTDKRDPKLIEKLMSEKDVIASVLVTSFIPVLKNGFTTSSTSEQMLKDLINEVNPTKAFIEDCIISNPSGYIRSQDFKLLLRAYCSANGYDMPKMMNARHELMQSFLVTVVRQRFPSDLGNVRAFKGVSFKKNEIQSLDSNYALGIDCLLVDEENGEKECDKNED